MGNCVTSGPNEALLKSGLSGTTVAVGQTQFRFWICQRVQTLSLELMTIELESIEAETIKGVRVSVKAVAQVKVKAYTINENGEQTTSIDKPSILLAAQHFLGDDEQTVRENIRRTLEGHQRQILGTLTVEELYKERQAFASKVRTLVLDDLHNMGYALASYVVQKIEDSNQYMASLGVTQTALVKRNAAEGESKNDCESRTKVAEYNALAEIAEAESAQRAHVASTAQLEIQAQSDRDLALKRAAYAREVKTAEAEAEAAAGIESAKQNQSLTREKIKGQQVEETILLDIATIKVQRAQREKEGHSVAEVMMLTNQAKGVELLAGAEAEKIKAIGRAEADVIRMRGEAEASVLEKRATAFSQFGDAAIIQLIVDKMPEIAKNLSKPLENTDKMIFISTGAGSGTGGPSNFVSDMTNMMGMIPDAVEGLTGFDIKNVAKNISAASQQKRKGEITSGAVEM